jgi:hypothetical protein
MSRPVQSGSYRIVPVPTVHSSKVRSLGYVVEKRRRRVFFSSDLVSIQRRYRRRLGRLDLVITEGSYMRHPFGSWFYRDIPASIQQIAALGDGVRTSAARDGLVINI